MYDKGTPAHSLETKGATRAEALSATEVLAVLSDDFMEKTDGWSFGEQVWELGTAATSEVICALIPRRAGWRGSGKKGGKGEKGGGKGKGGKGDRQFKCANCGSSDNENAKCPKGHAEGAESPCFDCGKPGHRANQCPNKKGRPAKTVEAEGDEEDIVNMCIYCEDEGDNDLEGVFNSTESSSGSENEGALDKEDDDVEVQVAEWKAVQNCNRHPHVHDNGPLALKSANRFTQFRVCDSDSEEVRHRDRWGFRSGGRRQGAGPDLREDTIFLWAFSRRSKGRC